MKERKLFALLKLLDEDASKRLSKFVASPYYNSLQKVEDLCTYFLQFHPIYDDDLLTEEYAFTVIYPDRPFQAHELNRYMSKLFHLVEKFLEVEAMESTTFINKQVLAEHLYEIQALPQFESAIKKGASNLNKQLPISSANYLYTYLNKKLNYNYRVQIKKGVKSMALLQESFQALDNYYLAEMLQAAATLHFENKEAGANAVDMPLLESGMTIIRNDLFNYPPLLQIWFLANELLREPQNETHYRALKQTIVENLDEIPPIDARNLLTFLRKSAANHFSESRIALMEEYFELFEIQIDRGWVYAGGTITYSLLSNIIGIALKLNRISWAQSFLQKSTPYLLSGIRENTLRFNMARIAFAQGDFSEAGKHLFHVNPFDLRMTLAMKRLQLMVNLEEKEATIFESNINSFRVYIHRLGKDVTRERLQQVNAVFANAINTLFRYSHQEVLLAEVKQLFEELEPQVHIPEYEYLTAKTRSAIEG